MTYHKASVVSSCSIAFCYDMSKETEQLLKLYKIQLSNITTSSYVIGYSISKIIKYLNENNKHYLSVVVDIEAVNGKLFV
jgi:16S rRNA C1402 (ribose-2'-O) methylase RsmI